MPGPSRIELRRTDLQCNECGCEFAGPWPYASVVGSRLAPVWVPERDGGDDLRCPSCGSNLIGRAGRGSGHDRATSG